MNWIQKCVAAEESNWSQYNWNWMKIVQQYSLRKDFNTCCDDTTLPHNHNTPFSWGLNKEKTDSYYHGSDLSPLHLNVSKWSCFDKFRMNLLKESFALQSTSHHSPVSLIQTGLHQHTVSSWLKMNEVGVMTRNYFHLFGFRVVAFCDGLEGCIWLWAGPVITK